MSQPSFKDGEAVWVKWGSHWWPGEVWSESRVPQDVRSSLRKPPIVFVKFFQEDAFEFVRSHNNIMKYSCEKKLDFIRKGMDKYRSNIKIMENFPADVVKAEQLTGGNARILENLESPTKQKANTSVTATSPAIEKSISESSPAPTASKKATGAYNSATKVQVSSSPAPKSDKKISCPMCNFSTDRMNLLMFHIKSHSSMHSPRVSEPATPEVKKFNSSPKKKTDDSIADDVRKIKESMKKEPKAKKSREVVKTPVTSRTSRSAKKEVKEVKEEVVKVEEKPKPKPVVNELKKELLADWSDDEDADVTMEKVEVVELPPPPKPTPSPEKVGESSRSIRNIPKKQRVSEVYIQPEPVKVEQPKEPTPPPKQPSPDVSKKPSQKAGSKRKHEKVTEPEPKKSEESTDDSLLMATADLLNETEVPKVENAQLPSSTFHKSNDIDKRNLPPKERNKRIFRANNNGTSKDEESATTITSPIQNELMLPHKKKQSSRLLTAEKTLPVTTEARKKRNVSGMEAETNSNEPTIFIEPVKLQSPLRDTAAVEEVSKSKVPSESISAAPRRGQKRRNSKDSHQASLEDTEACSEPKKIHKSDSDLPPRSIVACATETICITSKGQLSVARRDSLVTTQANTVMVTSQVIITEATRQPIVSSAPSTETILTPKPQIAPTIKIPKNALKFPAEKLVEMKKQGLVTVGIDKKNKLTEKGKQIFKDIQKTAEAVNESNEIAVTPAPELEQTKTPEVVEVAAIVPPKDVVMVEPEKVETNSTAVVEDTKVEEKIIEEEKDEEKKVEEVEEEKTQLIEPNESPAPKEEKDTVDESTNNNDVEKESITTDSSKDLPEETIAQDPVENGKEVEADSTDDANNGGAGLIALQAETFGGPPNCFYLCRQVEDRYEPVDNQILVLNAQNALVPYEEDIVTDDSLAPTDVSTENLTGYPQLSPNSNIIINTPNGQKIELNHFTILALQEQADENGIASIELSGEQLELNINGILEAISQQQEANESEAALIPGALLIDGDSALILDTSDIPPVEIHHTATQVSETLSKPIMSTTVAPEISSVSTKATISETVSKNLNIEDSLATIGVTASQPTRVPKCLELPITVTNPTIAETVKEKLANSAPVLGDLLDVTAVVPETFVVQSAADNGSQD